MRVLTWCLICALSVSATPAFAGSDYTFSITDIEGAIGTSQVATVAVDIADGATAIDGWQLSVCHDPDLLGIDTDDGVVSLELGDPQFESWTIESGYWFVGAVIDFGGDTLATGGDAYEATYDLIDTGEGDLTFCEDGLDADGLNVAVGGVATSVLLEDGAVDSTNPFTFVLRDGSSSMDASGGTGTASILFAIRNDAGAEANAFSVSIVHDDAVLTPTSAVEQAALLAVDDGSGPGFYSASFNPDDEVGTTVGCLFSLTDFDVTLVFDEDDALIEFGYDVDDGPDCDLAEEDEETSITFEDINGVINEVIIETTQVFPELDESENVIVLTCSGGSGFLRGDCDGNGIVFPILDALYVLEYGFVNGPTPPCLAASDCDGNGIVFPILDALYVLEYGFVNGPAPPDPGPTDCGPDTNDPGPGCETPPDICL